MIDDVNLTERVRPGLVRGCTRLVCGPCGEHWACTRCGTRHQRDDNAAINLARYEEPRPGDSALGPVGATVKRGADRKTRPSRAGGDEARKGTSRQAGEQPRDGVLVGGPL
jgi:putative transposase